MSTPIFIMIIVIGLLFIGLLALLVLYLRKNNLGSNMDGMHPQGFGLSMGISIGAGFGVALGTALKNLGLGIAIGVTIGIVFGGVWEYRNKDKIRPLTEQEKKVQRLGIILGIIMLLIGVGVFMALLLS